MQEQNIPIDIQTSKLLDWLISRRHCTKTWGQQTPEIREKINLAIQDMPEHKGITKLLTGTYINYFHCLQIIEILKETEADSRSIFGRYGSQRMKDWQEIVKLYERDNVYLAEAAQTLMRNVAYEIPGQKKSITKCETLQNEYEKKEADCAKHAQDFRDKYSSLCNQMGIEGKDIKKEIGSLLGSLPKFYQDISKQAKQVSKACQYYQSFVKHMTNDDSVSCLPLLQYVIDNGNTTVYEWRYGEAPLRIEEPRISIEETENVVTDSIDFEVSDIDFGTEVELETGDIDWGQIDMLNDAHEATIDFTTGEDAGIVVQDAGVEGGVAKDNEALTVLDYHKTRNTFIDDILELEAFLRQRYQEMQSSSSNQSQMGFSLSHSNDEISKEELEVMISQVAHVFDAINQVKLKQLALIRESPRYVDRLANSLQQQLKFADKMEATRKLTEEKRHASMAEQKRLQPLVHKLVEKTKELQVNIEQSVSKKYNNRPVHITGGVTTL